MNIEPYPIFQPIVKAQQSLFDDALQSDPPTISEFTFTNLFAWRESYKLSVSMLGRLFIIRSDAGQQPKFFNPIGMGNKKNAIEKVTQDLGGIFIRVPEETWSLFNNNGHFAAEIDWDNSDYVYATNDLIALSGRKYDGKRNLIKKFKSLFEYEYIKVDASKIGECLAFEEDWCSLKNCNGVEGLNNERRAIREMAAHFYDFGLIAGAIKMKGRASAIACGQRLNEKTFVLHVLKADPSMVGLYQLITNEFLSREARDFDYVNFEQDLGVAGLRKTKLSYHPIERIKKYTLRRVGSSSSY